MDGSPFIYSSVYSNRLSGIFSLPVQHRAEDDTPKNGYKNPAVSPGVRYISFISCSPAESGSAIIIKFALISFVSLPSTYAVNPSEYGMERQRSFGEERFMVPVIRLVEKEALSLCRSRFSKTSFPRESAESAYCSISWHTIPSSSKR